MPLLTLDFLNEPLPLPLRWNIFMPIFILLPPLSLRLLLPIEPWRLAESGILLGVPSFMIKEV